MRKGNSTTKRNLLLFFIILMYAEALGRPLIPIQMDFTVTGTVTDKNNMPLNGVSVQLKSKTAGTTTDDNGVFSIKTANKNDTLIVSSVGYQEQEVAINGRQKINIQLLEEEGALNEVVVVGYGEQKKSSLTTAVTAINGEKLVEQSASGDLRKALQGMAPGLVVLDNGGKPGSNQMQMQIRGVSSVNGSEPLVLVDGQVMGSLNSIDPNSVESISILKDAASTAIYGSRGSNGIILVTTKKGKKGKIGINYEGVYGLQTPTVLPKFLSTEEFLRYRNILAANEKQRAPASTLPTYTEEEIQEYLANMQRDPIKYPSAAYDLKDIYRTAPQTRHSLTLSGGGDFLQSMLNISYYDQAGLIQERSFTRMNVRMNNSFNIAKSLTGHMNLFYETSKRKMQASGFPEYEAVQGLHNQTQKYGLGGGLYYDSAGNYIPKKGRATNPRLDADTRYMGVNETLFQLYTIDAGLEWRPIKGLKLSSSYAIQNINPKENYNIPRWDLGFAGVANNALYFNNQRISRKTFNFLGNYEKSFGNHNMALLAGYATEEYRAEGQDMYGQNFFSNDVRNIATGKQENIRISNSFNEWGLRSYFGRLAYNYDGRYYLETSLRSDGSSRFPKANRYSQFPGASAGWRISRESFWESLSTVISELKIRYSYGQTGSHDGVGNYSYIPQLILGQRYGFSTGPGGEYAVNTIIQNTLVSSELFWEKVTQQDLGIDFGLLQNKLTGTFDFFTKTTNGILLDLPVPAVIGLNPSKVNAGRIDNRGWEFSIQWKSATGSFQYNLGAGIARVKDKLTNYGGLGITVLNGMYARWEGSPLYAIRGYKTVGIYQTDEEAKAGANIAAWKGQMSAGDYQYEDVNGDGKIDVDNDAQLLGSRTPEYTFNVNGGFNWKGIDMNMLWNGAANVQTVITGYLGEGGQYNNSPVSAFLRNNYWTKEGDTKVHFSRPLWRMSNNLENNSRNVADAGYFRLKSLTIGYTLPKALIGKTGANIRVFFAGTNLLTISKIMKNWGVDPEDASLTSSDGDAQRHIYPPQLKTYNFGINIQF